MQPELGRRTAQYHRKRVHHTSKAAKFAFSQPTVATVYSCIHISCMTSPVQQRIQRKDVQLQDRRPSVVLEVAAAAACNRLA